MGKNFKKILKSLKFDESIVSMVLGALIVIIVGVLVFNYFSKINRNESTENSLSLEDKIEENLETSPTPIVVSHENLPVNNEALNKAIPNRYKVLAGDSLWKIAEKYYNDGYKWTEIAKVNKLTSPDSLSLGMDLVLPKLTVQKGDISVNGATTIGNSAITTSTYTVLKGDDLWDIALRACGDGYKWTKIAKDNKLENPEIIHAGNKFKISCK